MILSVKELININEMMLGRGAPTVNDGIGYNKGDYNACEKYYYGMSYAQVADLARRLVKYCNTQLKIDKKIMIDTAKHYEKLAGGRVKDLGVSVDVVGEWVFLSFAYNERFINIIRNQPYDKRKYDTQRKQWAVKSDIAINVLKMLKNVDADVDNAIQYLKERGIGQQKQQKKQEEKQQVLVKVDKNLNKIFLKLDYQEEIIKVIRRIDKKQRFWNPKFKYWTIDYSEETLKYLENEIKKYAQINYV